jgi:hypothetical protein
MDMTVSGMAIPLYCRANGIKSDEGEDRYKLV